MLLSFFRSVLSHGRAKGSKKSKKKRVRAESRFRRYLDIPAEKAEIQGKTPERPLSNGENGVNQ